MTNIAILGYGTVGSGVAEVIGTNAELLKKRGGGLYVKYILDLREFPGDPYEDRVVHDFDVILADPEIKVICETMGGVGAAYKFSQQALEKGISVCTSNKELVELHGAELSRIAKEHNCSYLFEASVGGGIPLLRTIVEGLAAEKVERICGILNGTTNFILTKMAKEGAEFDTVLAEAQEHGYAEKDPTADIEGHDAGRKIAILASLVTGQNIAFPDVHTEGITKLTPVDFAYAKAMDMQIKLIALYDTQDGKHYGIVSPRLIGADSPLSCVQGVFNGVLIHSNMLDDSMYYGRGAGRKATASAVVGDAMAAAASIGASIANGLTEELGDLAEIGGYRQRYFLRLKGSKSVRKEEVENVFGKGHIVFDVEKDEFGFLMDGEMEEAQFISKMEQLQGVIGFIRVL